MFGGNAFAWPPFAGGFPSIIRNLPGFVSGYVIGASLAEVADLAASASSAHDVAAAGSDVGDIAGARSMIHDGPAYKAEVSDRRGGIEP